MLGRAPVIKRKEAARTPKAMHAQESREACEKKAAEVADSLDAMRLGAAAKLARAGVAAALAYTGFPPER